MDSSRFAEQVKLFKQEFNSEFEHFLKSEEYIALFQRWLTIIEQKYEKAVQPYLRLILCEKIVGKLRFSPRELIANCLMVVEDDMTYAIENDYDPKEEYNRIFSMRANVECLASAMAHECSCDFVALYLDYMLLKNGKGERFAHAMNMFHHTVSAYVKRGEYEIAKYIGTYAVRVYNKKIKKYPALKHDAESHLKKLEIALNDARAALGELSMKKIQKAQKSKQAHVDSEQEMRNRVGQERQDMMDLWAEANSKL